MLVALLANGVLSLTGWRVEGHYPGPKRAVLLAAPHTSNWDFLYMQAICLSEGVRVAFVAKHTLFWGPLGWMTRALGGIPVERSKRGNLVTQLAKELREREHLVLVVPPEGTRRYVEHWKSGFYHIAREAGVPVVLGYLDYARRCGGFGPALELTGDVASDMEKIREFYAPVQGRYPDQVGRILLKQEG